MNGQRNKKMDLPLDHIIPQLKISWCLKISVMLALSGYTAYIVYQGPANEVVNYFEMANKCKSKNRNPCDFFMREMSINYPKKQED